MQNEVIVVRMAQLLERLPDSAKPYIDRFVARYPTLLRCCSVCKKTLDASCFSVKSASKGLLNSTCLQCTKLASRKHYESHTEKVKARSAKAKQVLGAEVEAFIEEHKRLGFCSICKASGLNTHLMFRSSGLRRTTPVHQVRWAGLNLERAAQAIASSVLLCAHCNARKSASVMHAANKMHKMARKESYAVAPLVDKRIWRDYVSVKSLDSPCPEMPEKASNKIKVHIRSRKIDAYVAGNFEVVDDIKKAGILEEFKNEAGQLPFSIFIA